MDRKALLRRYKETPRPMGVFMVRNIVDERLLVGSSSNLPGGLNRARFDLENGTHRVRELQTDWDRLGARAFVFEVLDTLDPPEDLELDPSDDLAALLALWLDKIGRLEGAFYVS